MTRLPTGLNPRLPRSATAATTMWLLGLLGGTTSCTGAPEPSLGSVRIHLIGQAPSGAVYRLRHAIISVAGEGTTRIWNTEDSPDQTSLSDEVAVGNYTASVAPGWDLERIEGSAATPVMAELISSNPASFTVSVHQRTTVPLRFHVDTEDVDLAQGYEVVVGIEESPQQVIVVTNRNDDEAGSITVYPLGSSGDVAPVRTIAGPLTTLAAPAGVTVINNEIVVCDSGIGAVDFFPLLADGNVAPTRQIVGFDTGIDVCFDVAVFGDEVHVAQRHDLLVFPVTANGNVRPSRRISGFSVGGYLAIDSGELYMTHQNADGVFVFSLPLTDQAPPARSLSADCASGVAAGDGELFVVDSCQANLNVYPEAASGNVPPLRSFGGFNTGLQGPEQMTRFRNHLYVADVSVDRIWIFSDTAAGNPPPFTAISGPRTGLVNPIGVAVH